MKDKVLAAPSDLDPLASQSPRLEDALSRRINADPESVERGLVQIRQALLWPSRYPIPMGLLWRGT
jgi:hypothetical protein